jgi:hypothetical protein
LAAGHTPFLWLSKPQFKHSMLATSLLLDLWLPFGL